MRTLRQLSYTGTATLIASLALAASSLVVSGCGGEDIAKNMNPGTGTTGTGTNAGVGGSATTAGTDGGVGGTVPGITTSTTGAGGTTGGPDPSVCVPGIPATTQVPRLLNRQYDNVVRDILGVTTLASTGNQTPSSLLNNDFTGAMNTYSWDAYQNAAAAIASEVMSGANRTNFIACDAAAAGCFEQTIRDFGRKAFRRPLTEEEVTSFMRLTTIQPAGTPDEIAEAILYAFLVSPSFIMTPEMNPTVEGDAFKLSSHEVATRLSLMLWGSAPDTELSVAADADMLQTPDQIMAQASRMLQDRARTGPQISAAHRAYLQMDLAAGHWWKVTHDETLFPTFSPDMVPTMQAEMDAFFEEVAYTGGGFADLFLSPVAFVDAQTAPIYGLDAAAYTGGLTAVTLDATQRPGFLTRAGFLSSFSNFEATSPILRGAFITVNIIGVNPGAPDPDAFRTPIPPGVYETRRAQIEALTAGAECVVCHGQFVNPPGFVLENFDAVGGWQTTDPLGGAINSTATVTFSGDNVQEVTSPLQMMEQIAQTPAAKGIYAQALVSYAYGRLPNANDTCVVEDIYNQLSTDGYTVLNLFADLTRADSFRLRTAEQ